MADKGKKGKAGAAPEPAEPPPGAEPPPTDTKPQQEQKPAKTKSVQPKNEVGTRKGCRRYKWQIKDSNREFWIMGHAELKILSLVRRPGIPGRGPKDREGEE